LANMLVNLNVFNELKVLIMNNVFDLPAFFKREYYESRHNKHVERGNTVLAKWWRDAYYDNAVSYNWCAVYYSVLPVNGWKEAMKAADEASKAFEKEYKPK
jgi:hypothetical protein